MHKIDKIDLFVYGATACALLALVFILSLMTIQREESEQVTNIPTEQSVGFVFMTHFVFEKYLKKQ